MQNNKDKPSREVHFWCAFGQKTRTSAAQKWIGPTPQSLCTQTDTRKTAPSSHHPPSLQFHLFLTPIMHPTSSGLRIRAFPSKRSNNKGSSGITDIEWLPSSVAKRDFQDDKRNEIAWVPLVKSPNADDVYWRCVCDCCYLAAWLIHQYSTPEELPRQDTSPDLWDAW